MRGSIAAGSRYVRLTVLEDWSTGDGPVRCVCECGAVASLRRCHWEWQRSCGCLQSTYVSWRGMVERCTNPGHAKFRDYGGRGIAVCARWRDFSNFYADMGLRPEGLTIDRIDNDGNYEPGNCRWISQAEQTRNHRPRRKPTMCMRGLHELTPENVIPVKGGRLCKPCRAKYNREWHATAKQRRQEAASPASLQVDH